MSTSDDHDTGLLLRLREMEIKDRNARAALERAKQQLKSRDALIKRLARRVTLLEADLEKSQRWNLANLFKRRTGEPAPGLNGRTSQPHAARTAGAAPSSDRKQARALFNPRRDESLPSQKLEGKLWGGYSTDALRDLRALHDSPLAQPDDSAYASWALARWHFALGEFDEAHAAIIKSRLATAGSSNAIPEWLPRAQALLEAHCLIRFGRTAMARVLLEQAIRRFPTLSLRMGIANTYPADAPERLEQINEVLKRCELEPISKIDPDAPLSIANITATAKEDVQSAARISIIIPAFNAAETLGYAVRGLLAQTLQNIEIIIVNDASTDATEATARALADSDERIKYVHLDTNVGVNRARNEGLAVATGDYITVHDSDDWSHPRKLAIQIRDLEANPEAVGGISYWTRVGPEMYFVWGYRPQPSFIEVNGSSLLVPRAVMEKLGGWLPDRDSGDTEFIMRLQLLGNIARTKREEPLSFSFLRPASLTMGAAGNHIMTIHYGGRREYREAAEHWHRSLPPGEYGIDTDSGAMPFPVPPSFMGRRSEVREFDILFVMDFNLGGGAYHSTMNYVHAALRDGLRVGLFQWRRYDLDVLAKLNHEIRDMAANDKDEIVVAGDKVSATYVIVGYPSILNYLSDRFPSVSFKHLVIIINQMAERLTTGHEFEYDPKRVRANLVQLFGTEGHWVPISGHVREMMELDPRYPEPLPDIWTPLIDVESWTSRPLAWRGLARPRPTIGRHGRDHPNKWPSARDDILAAYCADRDCDVALLGGADHALAVIGKRPANWQIAKYGAIDVREFLHSIDFYLHYPLETYVEEFGRATIEAMAAGVPVILPEVFKPVFGDSALYAPPEQVWSVVERYWRDEQLYLERARAGREFVVAHCDWAQFEIRLRRLRGAGDA